MEKSRKIIKKLAAIMVAFAVAFTMIPFTAGDLDVNAAAYHRIYGQNRYDTAIKAADEYKAITGTKFENVIVAYGQNFPDALAGGYLAKVKNAPILLVEPSEEDKIVDYISKNITSGGKVYILGGTGVVSSSFEKKVEKKGINTKRLGGQTRYETNIKILKEAGVKDEDILVCTGNGFADSLSAAAVGKPILLVDKNLSDAQKEYIKGLSTKQFYLIGGEGVVGNKIQTDLKKLKSGYSVERLWGPSRYETSTEVAKMFFPKAKTVVLAYAQNFPDGLSGGPLAMLEKAPIILTDSNKTAAAKTYVKSAGATESITLGGPKLISDKAVKTIMGKADTPETPKPPASEPTKYTITWQNWNGTVLQTTSVEKGTTPKYTGSTPQKAADANYTYSFTGWSPSVVSASANATYTAQFKAMAKPASTTVEITDYEGTVRTVEKGSADYNNPLYNRMIDGIFTKSNSNYQPNGTTVAERYYIQRGGVTFYADHCSNGYSIRVYNGDAKNVTFELDRKEYSYTKWGNELANPSKETSRYILGNNGRRLAEIVRDASSTTSGVTLFDLYFDIGDVKITAKYNGTAIDSYTLTVNNIGQAGSDGLDDNYRGAYEIAKKAVACIESGKDIIQYDGSGSPVGSYMTQEEYKNLKTQMGQYYAEMKAIEAYVMANYEYSEMSCKGGYAILKMWSVMEYGEYGNWVNPIPENTGHVAFRPYSYCEKGWYNTIRKQINGQTVEYPCYFQTNGH